MCQVSGEEKRSSLNLRQHYLDQFFGSPTFHIELSAFVVPVDGRLAPHFPDSRTPGHEGQGK